jgi:hypothetical protein
MTEAQTKAAISRLSKYADGLRAQLASKTRKRGGTEDFLKRDLAKTEAKIADLRVTAPTEAKKS